MAEVLVASNVPNLEIVRVRARVIITTKRTTRQQILNCNANK